MRMRRTRKRGMYPAKLGRSKKMYSRRSGSFPGVSFDGYVVNSADTEKRIKEIQESMERIRKQLFQHVK